jgi:hypothetical protein
MKSDKSAQFIERLKNADDITPALRASYQAELETMLEPKLTTARALPGIGMLLMLVVCVVLIVRNMFIYNVSALILTSWAVLAVAFSAAGYFIVRDLWRGKHSQKSVYSISQVLSLAAGAITVASLLMGLSQPSKPESMFGAFFSFVFYFACSEWVIYNRIAVAELASREQMLRIECRLADLAGRIST